MKLDSKSFDVPNELFDEFFAVLDKYEKVILSNDTNPKPILDSDKEKYCIYEVADHIFALPKEAKVELEEFMIYL